MKAGKKAKEGGKTLWSGGIFWLFLLSLIVFSCQTPESITSSRIKSLEQGLLRSVYFKGEKPEKLRLSDRMSFYKVPGLSLAVMDKYQVEWTKTYGFKEIINYQPLTNQTVFQVGELSQPVAAAVTLRLVEDGQLKLDEQLGNYYLEIAFAGRRFQPRTPFSILIKDLLSHQAGFYPWISEGYSCSGLVPDLTAVLRGEEPANNFHSYRGFDQEIPVRFSDFNYVLLEKYLTEQTGLVLQELAKEKVLGKLSLKNTFFGAPLTEDLAVGHLREGPEVEGQWFCYPEQAARGLWSTPEEYLKLMIELMDCARGKTSGLLSPTVAREMLSFQTPRSGYGFRLEGERERFKIYLKGKTKGYRAAMLIYPALGQGAVAMTNSENGWVLIDEIFRGLSVIYDWPDFKPEEKTLFRLSPEIYQQYTGRYMVNDNYFLDIDYQDYYLTVHPTGQAATKFYVETQTIFFSVDPFIRIKFNLDERGQVTGLVLWQEDYEIQATKIN
ncbi:MAG: serine hydrolase [Acidobacteriota bacterium]|nr:serine hydrolase [Acidobacteriota bacterium]MDW3229878.1 serine hydrolase [Acidobacteriota bacterium]MDY0231540.1 serine hydrolase domain-containing protein [Candidatus Saccharicenans sp.]